MVLPRRAGARPATSAAMPHAQLDQTAPRALQEALLARAASLPGVTVGPSRVSVPGARAFHLDPRAARGPPAAFMRGAEFGHLHPPHDGSLHLALPDALADEALAQGWAEEHPLAREGVLPGRVLLVFGPRDEAELDAVWSLVRAAHAFATGTPPPEGAGTTPSSPPA